MLSSQPTTTPSSSILQQQQHRQRTQQQRFSGAEEFQPYRDDPVRYCVISIIVFWHVPPTQARVPIFLSFF